MRYLKSVWAKIILVILGIVAILAVYLLFGFFLLVKFSIVSEDVARVASPSNKVEAVVEETNGGATTGFSYSVHVVPMGKDIKDGKLVASFEDAVRSRKAYGVNVKWQTQEHLVIEYYDAEFTYSKESVEVNNQKIDVSLRSGIEDLTAPPGGMLYNLQGRPHDNAW